MENIYRDVHGFDMSRDESKYFAEKPWKLTKIVYAMKINQMC